MFFCKFCLLIRNTYFVEHLPTAGSESPLQRSLFNKVASLTAWMPMVLLEKDSSTGIFLWILWNFRKAFLQNTSWLPLLTWCCFFPFCRSMRFAAQNQFIWCSNSRLGEGIRKPIQSCVVMEIRWELHCQVVATHVPT